jgi:hypothetical protein
MTVEITDEDVNNVYQVYVNGALKFSAYIADDALRMDVGGESTHEDNVLDGGRDRYLTIFDPDGDESSWDSSNLYYIDDASYTNGWNTQYTDFHYEGP